jgi:hypothetical protein
MAIRVVAPSQRIRRCSWYANVWIRHETWLRFCLVLAGLHVPECNLVIGDDDGPIGRVDLVYLAYQLILE